MTEGAVFEQWASLVTSLAAHRPAETDHRPQTVETAGPDETARRDETARTVPVVVLTGFLGAGKSTLLAHLLLDPLGTGVVRAVVNDLGRLPFDPTLVASADDRSVELTNGCGCCLAGAVDEVGASLERAADGADLIVFEASGVADPAAAAQIVTARPGLRLDRIVAIVDAGAVVGLAASPATGSTVRRQLASADVVVLSHAEGGPAVSDGATSAIDEVRQLVADLAPGRPILASTLDEPAHRALTPAVVVGAGPPGPLGEVALQPVVETIEQHRSITGLALTGALADRPDGLLRAKGCLVVDGRPALVQLTPSGHSIQPAPSDGDGRPGLTLVAAERSAIEPWRALLGDGAGQVPPSAD